MMDQFSVDQERIDDLIKMGKTLGFAPSNWCAILQVAALQMQERFGFTIKIAEQIRITSEECNCDNCRKNREDAKRREGFHVVN